MKTVIRFIMFLAMTASISPAAAGNLDNAAAPTAGSGMPNTTEIYDRLDTGAIFPISVTFREPVASPTIGTGKTLADIQGKLPVPDNTNGAVVGEVLTGKTFWGLRTDGTWGPQAGTIITRPPSNATVSQPAGYYAAFDLSVVDTNLKSSNILKNTTIFGIAGSSTVMETSTGTSAASDIKSGKTAFVNGALVTGTLYGGYTCSGTMNGTRWCDNGNGTVRDMTTGLIWLKDASWGGTAAWAATFDKVSTLANGAVLTGTPATLTDGSAAGDWRMPTIAELLALTTGTEAVKSGTPRAFTSVQDNVYWSSSSFDTALAWNVYMGAGYVYSDGGKGIRYYVWPVRSGQ
jgi:hypothetical protein